MLLFLTLIVALSPAHAKPDPCAIVQSGTSPFGGPWRGTTMNVFSSAWGGELTLGVDDTGPFIISVVYVFADSNAVVRAGTVGKLALTDGTVVEVKVAKDAAPATTISDVATAQIRTEWSIRYAVDAAALSKLGSAPLQGIVTDVGGRPAERYFVPGVGKKFQTVASCLAAAPTTP